MKSKGLALHKLSRRERQILDVVYAKGQVSAAQIREELADPPSYSTVRALLRIMEDKGYLEHEKDGNRYLYRTAQKHKGVEKSALQQVLQTFFGGSVERAVTALLSSSDTRLSSEELERLSALIEGAKEK
jgi:predicted transcriptional regulator